MKKILLLLVPCLFSGKLNASDSLAEMRRLGYTQTVYTSETIWLGNLKELKKSGDNLDVSIKVSLSRPNTQAILNSNGLENASKFTAHLEIETIKSNAKWEKSSIENNVESSLKKLYDFKKIGESDIFSNSIFRINKGVDNISDYMIFLKSLNPFLKKIAENYILDIFMNSVNLNNSRLEHKENFEHMWQRMCTFGKVIPSKSRVRFADPIRNSM